MQRIWQIERESVRLAFGPKMRVPPTGGGGRGAMPSIWGGGGKGATPTFLGGGGKGATPTSSGGGGKEATPTSSGGGGKGATPFSSFVVTPVGVPVVVSAPQMGPDGRRYQTVWQYYSDGTFTTSQELSSFCSADGGGIWNSFVNKLYKAWP